MTNLKKELEKKDQIQSLLATIRSYVELKRKVIFILSCCILMFLILSAGGYLYYLKYERMAAKEYATIFEKNLKQQGAHDNKSLIKEYGELIKNYPYSNFATISYFRLGNLYYYLGEIDLSIENFNLVLANISSKSDLATLSYLSLGECYEVKKDFKKAIEFYEKAITSSKGHIFEHMIYANMARSYENMKEYERAKDFYARSLAKVSDKFLKIYISRKISNI